MHRVDRRITWEVSLHKLNSSGSGQIPFVGFCNCSKGLTGSIKDRIFLYNVNDCRLLKKDSAP